MRRDRGYRRLVRKIASTGREEEKGHGEKIKRMDRQELRCRTRKQAGLAGWQGGCERLARPLLVRSSLENRIFKNTKPQATCVLEAWSMGKGSAKEHEILRTRKWCICTSIGTNTWQSGGCIAL